MRNHPHKSSQHGKALLLFFTFCLSFISLNFFCLQNLPANAAEAIAILDLKPKGSVTESDASILTDRVRSLIVQGRSYQVMERENMDRILKEQGFQSTQICDTEDCYVELGRLLAVRQIMTGSVSKLGNLYTLNLRVIDVEKGLILQEEYVDCLCLLETLLTQTVPELVRKMTGPVTQPSPLPSSSESAAPVRSEPSGESWQLPGDWSETGARHIRRSLVYLEGGSVRFASLGYLFNLNDYIGLGLHGGLHGPPATSSVWPYPGLNARIYTNPHNLAGFLDLGVSAIIGSGAPSFYPIFAGKLGLEYRSLGGFTVSISGGAAINIFTTYSPFTLGPDVNLALGWAF